MSIALEVKNLSKNYRLLGLKNRVINALDNLSFKLEKGKTLAIVGESGSGKSTLAKQLVGIDEPTSGSILIDEIDISSVSGKARKQLHRKVRMVFQNPASSLNPNARIDQILTESLRINTNLDANQRNEKLQRILKQVGLQGEHYKKFPHMFSGGQQQRIAIARALMLDPSVIVADEPLSALDVSVQAQILNLIMDLQENINLSIVFISHDLGVVEHIADHVLVMYRGQLMEYGSVAQIFDSPKHPYTRKLLASTPSYRNRCKESMEVVNLELSKRAKKSNGCVFAHRCHYAQERCVESQPVIIHQDEHQIRCFTPVEK